VLIAGIDEAGRGPLAGPVVASAVILDPSYEIAGIKDSKQLSAKQREKLAIRIRQHALTWSVGQASPEEIDCLNILQATFLAMQRAVKALNIIPDRILVDGTQSPPFSIPTQTLIKGDQTSTVIGAASILAKVTRDQIMCSLHEAYPEYGFNQHKGYGTLMHRKALEQYGYTPVHRLSFAPVKKCKAFLSPYL
jgi:ribonuclease HII